MFMGVHLRTNMYAVMSTICMLSASVLSVCVCVCVSDDSRLIKLLHSNELWLSVWQLL